MNKFVLYSIILVFALSSFGCAGKPRAKISDTFTDPSAKTTANLVINSENQETEAKKADISIEALEKGTNTVFEQVDEVQSLSTDEEIKTKLSTTKSVLRVMLEHFPALKTNIDNIMNLAEANMKLGKNVANLEKTIKTLESEKKQSENDAIKKLYANMNWIFGFGFLALIGGAFVFIWEKRIGMTILAIGILTLAFSAAAIYYLKWVATIGIWIILIGCGLCVVLVGYTILKAYKQKNILELATKENIKLIEECKKYLPDDKFDELFGDDAESFVNQVQSTTTKSLVDSIRLTEGLTNGGATGNGKP